MAATLLLFYLVYHDIETDYNIPNSALPLLVLVILSQTKNT